MTEQKETRINLGGLWANTSKAGDEYFSGKFGYGGKILVFKNGRKEGENDPDYNMYLVPAKKREDSNDVSADVDNDSEVPF